MSERKGWIGFDLDGTLATYTGWKGETHIGEPVPRMIALIRKFLDAGIEVRVFTARVTEGQMDPDSPRLGAAACREIIQDWTQKHLGIRLKVTNIKDYSMIALYDDRAIGIEENTGLTKLPEPQEAADRFLPVIKQFMEQYIDPDEESVDNVSLSLLAQLLAV